MALGKYVTTYVCTTSIHHSISFPILYDLCLSRLAEVVEGRLLLKGSLSYSPYYVTKRGAGSIWNGIVIYNPSWHEIEHVYFKVFLQVMALLCMYVYTVCVSASYMCVCVQGTYTPDFLIIY